MVHAGGWRPALAIGSATSAPISPSTGYSLEEAGDHPSAGARGDRLWVWPVIALSLFSLLRIMVAIAMDGRPHMGREANRGKDGILGRTACRACDPSPCLVT